MNWDWEKLKEEHDKEKDKPKSKKEKKTGNIWVMVSSIIIMIALASSFLWLSFKWIAPSFSYKNKVQQEIIEMVKPEALKEKYKNKKGSQL